MQLDLLGRVENIKLPHSKALSPLYEAIVNSFQAIEDLGNKNNTHITISIVRDHPQSDMKIDLQPITSIIVEDNGIGFNQQNYHSFNTSDSLQKAARGGKGIGRFLWLKAFDSVNVNSIFHDNGKFFNRRFNFMLKGQGSMDDDLVEVQEMPRNTVVSLKEIKKD